MARKSTATKRITFSEVMPKIVDAISPIEFTDEYWGGTQKHGSKTYVTNTYYRKSGICCKLLVKYGLPRKLKSLTIDVYNFASVMSAAAYIESCKQKLSSLNKGLVNTKFKVVHKMTSCHIHDAAPVTIDRDKVQYTTISASITIYVGVEDE